MRDLNIYLATAKSMLDSIKIKYGDVQEIIPNSRAKSRWGQCKKLPNGKYSININSDLLDEKITPDDFGLKNTVVHELLHTAPGGHSHTGKWAEYASKVNSVYHLDIKRTSSMEEKGVNKEYTPQRVEDSEKYCVECTRCGYRWYYARKGKVVKYADRCTHQTDGGHLRRVW